MKYSDVKDKIEKYFREVDPDRLYDLAISYGMRQVDKEEKSSEKIGDFENKSVIKYVFVPLKVYNEKEESNYSKTASNN